MIEIQISWLIKSNQTKPNNTQYIEYHNQQQTQRHKPEFIFEASPEKQNEPCKDQEQLKPAAPRANANNGAIVHDEPRVTAIHHVILVNLEAAQVQRPSADVCLGLDDGIVGFTYPIRKKGIDEYPSQQQ